MAKTLYTFQADLRQLEKLQKLLKEANKELNNMKKGTDVSKKGLKEQKDSVDRLNRSLEEQKRKAAGIVKSTNSVSGAGRNMINVFKSAAVAIAAAFAVRAIAGGVRGMINVFREFESRMAGVKAISGATEEQFADLEKTALELGRSTVFSAAQIAKLQEEFARLGFSTDEIIAAQTATIDLAAATGEDLGNAAATAGSVLRAFGYEASQTARIVDVMASSFTGSALNLERFTESMKFVAPIAKNVGFTVEETTAMLMKLADAGLHGSIAGNALKNIFLELGNSGSKLSKHLGGPVDGLDELVLKLQHLREEGFGATQAAELLNKRATPAFLALIDSADGLNQLALDLNMADGAARNMAAIRLDTLEGDIIILKSAMEGLGIAMADTFDLTLRGVVVSLTDFFQSLAENETLLNRIRSGFIILTGVIATLATKFAMGRIATVGYNAVMGIATAVTGQFTAATIRGRLATALWGGGLKGFTTAFSKMTTQMGLGTMAMRGFSAVLRLTPWGIAIGAGISLINMFTDMGDEIEETAFKQDRLNNAMNDELDSILSLTVGTEQRTDALKNLAKQFPEVLGLLDIELATNEEIEKIQSKIGEKSMVNKRRDIANQKEANAEALKNAEADREALVAWRKKVEELGLPQTGAFKLMTDEDLNNLTDEERLKQFASEYKSFIDQINSIGKQSKKSGNTIFENTGLSGEELENTKVLLKAAQNEFSKFFEEVKGSTEGFDYSLSEQFDQGDLITQLGKDGTTIYEFSAKLQNSLLGLKWVDDSDFGQSGLDKLEKFQNEYKAKMDAWLKDNKDIQDLLIEDGIDHRMGLRIGYLKELDEFRDFGRKKQEAVIKQAEDEMEVLEHSIIVQNMLRQGQVNAAEAYTVALGEIGLLVKKNMEDGFDPNEAVVQMQELRRHISNLRSNLNKSLSSGNSSVAKSNKFRLENTKDYYKKLRNLQASFYEDELEKKEQQSLAKLDFTEKEMEQEIAMNRANIKEIERIQGRIKSGKEAGEFISSKNIIKNYDVLKGLTKETIKDIENVYKNYTDGTQGLTETITLEMVSIGENGEEVITEVVTTLSGVLDMMIEEEQGKMATNFQYMATLTEQFNRKMAKLNQERSDQSTRTQLEYFQALLEAEQQGNEFFAGDAFEGTNRFSRARDVMETVFLEEKNMLAENRDLKIGFIEEDRDRTIAAAIEKEATEEELTAIRKRFAEQITEVEDQELTERTILQTEYAQNVEDNIKEQIEHYAELYNQIFGMFAQLQNNALDMQLKRDQMYHESKSEMISDELARELELVEGNQEAQQALRELYADKQETLDDQLAAKETAIAKKRFQMEKANNIVQAIINGALAVTKVTAQSGVLSPVIVTGIIAMTAAQIAVIASQQFVGKQGGIIPEFAKGGVIEREIYEKGGVVTQIKEKSNKIIESIKSSKSVFESGGVVNREVSNYYENGGLVTNNNNLKEIFKEGGMTSFATERTINNNQKELKYKTGGMVYGPSHDHGGVKFAVGGQVVELEGGEAVINKRSTAMFRDQLSAMNVAGGGKKFNDGGITPGSSNLISDAGKDQLQLQGFAHTIVKGINSKKVTVTESDISTSQNNVAVTEATSSLF